MPSPVPVPKYPLVVLTPQTHAPSQPTLDLLPKLARKAIDSTEVYSVTFSPVLCPAGANWLFTLKPYWWEIDGKWVHRDGRRNPYCDAPQGQTQLEKMVMTVHTLALASVYLPALAPPAKTRLEQVLRTFFLESQTRMLPQVLYAQCNPSVSPLQGDRCFVIACRYLLLVSQSLDGLDLDPAIATRVKEWFESHTTWMRNCKQGDAAASSGNNITMWYHALVASHTKYSGDIAGKAYAFDVFAQLQASHPTPRHFFERELSRSRPRHYILFMLEPTFLLAAVTCPPPQAPPPAHILAYLESLVHFARTVTPGEIELNVDNDERYRVKLGWFEKMLDRWNGRPVRDELDGSAWEGGWNSTSRLLWGFL